MVCITGRPLLPAAKAALALLPGPGENADTHPPFSSVGTKQGKVEEDQRKLLGKGRRARVCEISLS